MFCWSEDQGHELVFFNFLTHKWMIFMVFFFITSSVHWCIIFLDTVGKAIIKVLK